MTPAGDTPSRKAQLRIVFRVAPYLWPKGRWDVKARVVISMALLVLAKVAVVSTPFFFKGAVDMLAGDAKTGDASLLWAAAPLALVLGYGLMRFSGNLFQQLRDVVFSRVGQEALRLLAIETFRHIHALSLRYHLERQTGALSRVIERGVKAIEFLLRFLLFSIVPLTIELLFVAGILFFSFDWRYLVIVLATIAAYVVFTFRVTEWRVKIRQRMNEQDMAANQKAIDSLLN
ncbi:MAG: ABC transporter transmembrane domain-containing protein, partial [Pseudomonadota bacterium]